MGLNPNFPSLGSQNDVAFNTLTNNDFLKYDGSVAKWRNAAFDPSSFGAEPVGLSDTTKISVGLRAGINARDYLTGTQYQTAALQAAIDACQAKGINDLVIPQRNLSDKSVAWTLDDTLVCFTGLRIHAENAIILQTVLGKPAFTIGAGVDGVEITVGFCNLQLPSLTTGSRPPMTSFIIGDIDSNESKEIRRKTSGIHSLGSRGIFKGRFAGFRNAVRLAKVDASDTLSLANNVDILVENVDFGLVYYGQEGLRADVRGSYIATDKTIDPPHLIYALSAPNIQSASKSCIIRGSAWDSKGFPFSFKGQNGTVCEVLQATNCGGVVIVTDPMGPITFGQIHGIQLDGLGEKYYPKGYFTNPSLPANAPKDVFVEVIRGDPSQANDSNGAPLVCSKTIGSVRASLKSTDTTRTLRAMSLDDDWTIGSIDIEYDGSANGTNVVSTEEALIHVYGDRSQLGMIKVRNMSTGNGVVGLRYADGTRGHSLSSSPSLRRITNGVVIGSVSESTFVINEETISPINSTYSPLVFNSINSSVSILGSATGGRRYGSGNWFPYPTATSLIGITPVQNNLYAMPIIIERLMTLSKIAINVSVAGGAGSAMRFGIYSDTTAGVPGAILYDIGVPATSGDPVIRFDVTSTGVKELTLAQPLSLSPGTYWIAYVSQSGASAEIRGVSGTSFDMPSTTSAAALSGSTPYMSNIPTGLLPTTFTVSGNSAGGIVRISYLVA